MLYVFDLDFTLWDCGGTWCDATHPPFRIDSGKVKDHYDRHIRLYPDVLPILDSLKEDGHQLALASRTYEPVWAAELIDLLDFGHYFSLREIYPSSKLRHFQALRDKTDIPFDNMVFFDDEMRNIREVSSLGVRSVYVENGLQWRHLEDEY